MKFLLVPLLLALTACSTLNEYGIGGDPKLMCSPKKQAYIDDKLVGSDEVSLTVKRRFKDVDKTCED